MIAIIDYGMGNLRSVEKAFKKLNAEVIVISDPKSLILSEKAILPGVGAFKDTMKGIDERGLRSAIIEFINSGKSYLGICMGLQILFEQSCEGGLWEGLGLLKGTVKRLEATGAFKVPHMGWNQVKVSDGTKERKPCPLLRGIPDNTYFYFDHSYYVEPYNKEIIAATTEYVVEFASVVWRKNIYGVQFHPEKSQDHGLKILENFISL